MPYRTAARARTGAFAPSSASVEGEYDFPDRRIRRGRRGRRRAS